MSSANDKDTGTAGTFNIKVYNGGNAICGPGANASITRTYYKKSCHKSKRPLQYNDKGLCYSLEEDKRSENLKGPDQLITNIPAKVYQKLSEQLSVGQSDCTSLASHIFPNIRQDEIEYLVKRYPTNQAKGVFKKMSERGKTLGQLVEALKSIERLDVIETLILAGYPKDSDTKEEDDCDVESCFLDEEEAALSSDEAKEEIPTQESICFEKNSYRLLIVEEPTITPKKDASSAPPMQERENSASHPRVAPGVVKNFMTRVCLAQFPTSPEENYTQVVSLIEDIKRY